MTHWGCASRLIAAGAIAVGGLGAEGALAQVTPEDIWQGWQETSATFGQALIADSVTREGDTLVARGIKTRMAQDGATLDGRLDEMRFRDLGDGTVEITASDRYDLRLVMPDEAGSGSELVIGLLQPGLRAVAGGNADETRYSFDLPNATLTVQALEEGAVLATAEAKMTEVTGSYMLSRAAEAADPAAAAVRTEADSRIDIQTLAFTLTAKEGENGADVTGTLAALQFEFGGSFLGLAAMEDMAKALRDGAGFRTAFRYGAGSFDIEASEAGRGTKINATNESGHFDFALTGESLGYGAGGSGVTMLISGDGIPFPELRLSYGEAEFAMLIPVTASEMARDFSFLTRIVDLDLPDEVWGIVDPTATLPRDPATLILEASGKARPTVDLFDAAAMETLGDAAPGELHALRLSEITARAAGAELTGSGEMTFDNSDLTSFDGVPAPTGKIELSLTGGNGLLDKLVAMGLVAAEEAMGMRMMLAMFATPGAAPDELKSVLEFRDKGFFANGQRLK